MSRKRSHFDRDIDLQLHLNIEKLKSLGNYGKGKDPYNRTDGEKAVARALKELRIRYIPEYVTPKLKGDTKSFRVVDFYLPKDKIYVEYLGRWNRGEEEHRRYMHKVAVYKKNGFKCVLIYPNDLFNVKSILKRRIEKANQEKEASKRKEKKNVNKSRSRKVHKNATSFSKYYIYSMISWFLIYLILRSSFIFALIYITLLVSGIGWAIKKDGFWKGIFLGTLTTFGISIIVLFTYVWTSFLYLQ